MLVATLLPALVLSRPPWQTAVQKAVYQAHAAKAQGCSDAAKPALLAMLDDPGFRQAIAGLPSVSKKNSSQLMEMLYQEIHYSYLSHNGYGGISLDQVKALGYLPSGWATVCEGLRPYDPNMANQNANEVQGMGFPDMPMPPAKPACWDRFTYTGLNLWKQSGGQLQFTPVGFVVDTFNDSSVFVSPIDTGAVGPGPTAALCMGTRTYFYHLVQPHLQFVGASLAQLYLRWYGKGGAMPAGGRYFEAEFTASFLLPERLLMMLVSFSLFGNDATAKPLTSWARTMKRPLIWADPADTGGSIVDSYVDQLSGDYNITKFDVGVYWGLYDGKATWALFRNKTTSHLQLHLLGYYNHHYCDPNKCKNCHFMGVNHQDQCLYWRSH